MSATTKGLSSSDFRWSFSKLTAYETCPHSFKLSYLDAVKQEQNAFAEYGILGHELLEDWATGRAKASELASEYEARYALTVTHSFPPFPYNMGQKYYQAGLNYFRSFNGFGDNYKILSTEEKFTLDLDGHLFVGIADLVLLDKESGGIIIMDHKSKSASSMSSHYNDYKRQLYIYAAHVKEKFGKFPAVLSFNMFRDDVLFSEDFDLMTYQKTMDWAISLINTIIAEEEWAAKKSNYFCKYVCGVRNHCTHCYKRV